MALKKEGYCGAAKNNQLLDFIFNFPKRDRSVARRKWWVRASELADGVPGDSLARRRHWSTCQCCSSRSSSFATPSVVDGRPVVGQGVAADVWDFSVRMSV